MTIAAGPAGPAEDDEAVGAALESAGIAGVLEAAAAGTSEPEAHAGYDTVEIQKADPIGVVADTPMLPHPRTETGRAWRVCSSS